MGTQVLLTGTEQVRATRAIRVTSLRAHTQTHLFKVLVCRSCKKGAAPSLCPDS